MGFVVIVALVSTFLISDYRDILEKNPQENLFVILNQSDRIELLGRSLDPSIEFVRWQYREDYIKVYFGSNLVGTSYWRIYDGIKQIQYKEAIQPYIFEDGKIMQSYAYYLDSAHNKPVGVLRKTIEVYPDTNKETVEWFPINQTKKYNLRWYVSDLDELNVSGTLKGEEKLYSNGFKVRWESDAEVSGARQFKNGRVEVIYSGLKGNQKIDPILSTLKVDDYVSIDKRDRVCVYNNPETCYPEMKIYNPFAKDLSVPCNKLNVLKTEGGFDVLSNVSFVESYVGEALFLINNSKICVYNLTIRGENASCVMKNGTLDWTQKYVEVRGGSIIYEALSPVKATLSRNASKLEFVPYSCPITLGAGQKTTFRIKQHISPFRSQYYEIGFLDYLIDPFINGTLWQDTFTDASNINYSRSTYVSLSSGTIIQNSTSVGSAGGNNGTRYNTSIPNMTAANLPAPFVAWSSTFLADPDERAAWHLFNSLTYTAEGYWISSAGNTESWIAIDLGATGAKAFDNYTLNCPGDTGETDRCFKNFTIQASNNNATWVVLDNPAEQTGWALDEGRSFNFTNAVAYRYWMINATSNNGDANFREAGFLAYRVQTGPSVATYVNGTLYSNVINETVDWTIAKISVNMTLPPKTNISFFVCDGAYSNCNASLHNVNMVAGSTRAGLTYIANFTTTDTTVGATLDEINISLTYPPPIPPTPPILYVEGRNDTNYTYEIYTTANVTAYRNGGGTVCISYNKTSYCGTSPLYLNLTMSVLNVNEDNESREQVTWYTNNVNNKTNLTFRFDNRTDLLSSKVRINGSADTSGLFPRNITINALSPQEEGNNESIDVFLPGELQGQNLTQITFWQNGQIYREKNFTMVSRSRQTFYLNLTNTSYVQILQWYNISLAFRGYGIDLTNQISFFEDFNSTNNISSNNMGKPTVATYDSYEGGDGLSRNAIRYTESGDCGQGSPNISASNINTDGYYYITPDAPSSPSDFKICRVEFKDINFRVVKKIGFMYANFVEPENPAMSTDINGKLTDGTNSFVIYNQHGGTGVHDGNNITVVIERGGTFDNPTFISTSATYTPFGGDLDFTKNWTFVLEARIDGTTPNEGIKLWYMNVTGVILPMNDTGGYGVNITKNVSSGVIQNTTEVISRAKFCCTLPVDDPDANTELYLSADNGTNWEKTSNCDFLAFANSGSSLRWRIGMNSTNGEDSDYVSNCSVEIVSGSVKNVTVDLGDDGNFEYQVNQTINESSNLNASINSSALEFYVSRNCRTRTCWVPIAVQTDGGGILNINVTFPQALGWININSSSWEVRENANAEFSWSKGKLTAYNFQNLYRGSFNSSIYANTSATSISSANLTLFVKYSKFNLSYPPNISFYDVALKNRTQFNATPMGQTRNRGIWNISSFAYDRKFDIYVWVNGTFSNGSGTTAINFSLNSTNGTMGAVPATLNGSGNKTGHLICKNLSVQNLTVVTGLSWFDPTPIQNSSFKQNWVVLNASVHSNDSAIHRFMFRVNGTNYTNINQSNFTLSNYTNLNQVYFSLNVTNLSTGRNYTFFAWVNLTTKNFYQSEIRSVISNTTNTSTGFVSASPDYDARYCNVFHYIDARNVSGSVQKPYFNIVSICDVCVRTWDFYKSNPVIQRI